MIALWLGLALAAPELGLPADAASWSVPRNGPVASAPWWESAGDPALQALISYALAENLDLDVARARVRQAQALTAQAGSSLLPAVSVDVRTTTFPTASLGYGQTSVPGQPSIADMIDAKFVHTGSATLGARWTPDLFGRNTLRWRAAALDAAASSGDRDASALQISTLLAEAYYDVVVASERVALVGEQVRRNRDLLEAMELRYNNGSADALAVLQQRQQLAASEALLPAVRIEARVRAQQLAVLTGRAPQTVLPVTSELPSLDDLPALGMPADLADHRPDLRAAIDRYRSAHQRRSASALDLLPALGVDAQTGWQASLFRSFDSQRTWSVGTSLSVPLFEGGRRQGALRQASAVDRAAAATVQAAWYQAVGDVEAAVVIDQERRAVLRASGTQQQAAQTAYDASVERYLQGVDSYLNVLTSLGALQQVELSLLGAQRDVVSARVQLYDALGGDWTESLALRDDP